MTDTFGGTWCFAQTINPIKAPADIVVFRCPDNLICGRSFDDPWRHYLWRTSLWHGGTLQAFRARKHSHPQTLLYSKSQLVEIAARGKPSKLIALHSDHAAFAFFVLWLSDAVCSLELGTEVALMDGWPSKRDLADEQDDGRAVKTLSSGELRAFALDWRRFCQGDETWLTEHSNSKGEGRSHTFPERVASLVCSARGRGARHSLDQSILRQVTPDAWTPLNRVVGGMGYDFAEGIIADRVLALAAVAAPSLLDIDVELNRPSLFSAVRVRLTPFGLSVRDDPGAIARVTPPLWMGGFDAR